MSGFAADGLPDEGFRGRWAGRNATFCNLTVRTGLRLSEQAALTKFDVPLDRSLGAYQRFWLPGSIAKGRSARWVYVPASVIVELVTYVEIDRAEVIEAGRAAGRYHRTRRPLVVEDPARPVATQVTASGVRRRIKVAHLNAQERRPLLVDGPDGLEPGLFWLGEHGRSLSVERWKKSRG